MKIVSCKSEDEKFDDLIVQSQDEVVDCCYGEVEESVAELERKSRALLRTDITEDDVDIIESWYVQARKLNNYTELDFFLKALMSEWNHDYGTVIHAMTAGSIATIHVMNQDEDQGGITGFQASCMMWQFMQKFNQLEGPMKLMQYEKMLYPQYKHRFDKTISPETWEWLQTEAGKKLGDYGLKADPKVIAHWETIVKGRIPFGYKVKVGDE